MRMLRSGWVALVAAVGLAQGCSPGSEAAERQQRAASRSSLNEVAVRAELSAVLSDSDQGLQVVTREGVIQQVQLEGRFQSAAMARRNPDGTLSTECFEDADAAIDFLQGEGVAALEVQ